MTAYRKGCRCPRCRAANADRVRRNRAARLADPSRLTHGTRSAYEAGCRCEDCTWARRAAYWMLEGGPRAHWWRNLTHETWWLETQVWFDRRETLAMGYTTEQNEFERDHPRPQFKHTLIGLAQSERVAS